MFTKGLTPRWRRGLWIAGVLLAVFTITGFFVLPPIVKSQLERRASEALGRKVTVGQVRINPYALSVTLENLDVRLKEGDGSFLGWNRLYVNFDALASLTGDWVLGAVELDGFHVTALLRPDGKFNFADIIERLNAAAAATPAPATPAKPARPVRVGSLKVTNARLDFADQSRSRPFATTFGPVSFAVTEFRTVGSTGAPYHFEAVSEAGERFVWNGTLSADPLASAGELAIENLQLPKYAAYYADRWGGELASGRLTVRGRYEAKFARDSRVLKLSGGAVELHDLKVAERAGGGSALELAALDVRGINADALTLKATVDGVTLASPRVAVRRAADGSLNLLALLPPASPAPAAAPAPASTAPTARPDILVKEFALHDGAVSVTDLAAPRAAELGLSGLEVAVKNATLADGASIPVQVSLNWNPRGTVKLDGAVTLSPELKAELKTDVAALEILPLSPYLEQFANAHLASGTVSTSGTARVALAGGKPAVQYVGGVALEQFGLVDGELNEPLVGFAALKLDGLDVALNDTITVALAEVNLSGPYARVTVAPDGKLNLAMVAKKSAAPAAPPADAAPAAPAAAAPLPKITVGQVVLADGNFSFTDRSLEPNVRTAITQFGGTIKGLSSENLARADVDLKATVDGTGPVAITGKLDPLGAKKFVDLKVDVRNVDLLPVSPYSGKYAGYALARGKLGVAVQAKLDGTKLDAGNVITLDQFTFGAPVESPDATKLPVRLGVALLKDLDGRIVIDVPISGDVADPSFGVGRVVVRVIVNLLTKAAVSPFALLGSMFGGGGDELAFQEFAPGLAELQPAETKKLETMVKALGNRPGLSVAIEGAFDGPADTHALKYRKLEALVRSRLWEERRVSDPNIPPPEKLEVTPEARGAMLKKLFDEKFPPGTEFGAPLPPAPVVAAAPAKPKRNFLGRVVDVITFRGSGEKKPASATPEAPPAVAPASATGPSMEEMTGRLAETMTVGDEDLRALATARAERVREYFLTTGGIAAERVFLAQGQAKPDENKGPRAFLSLQ